MSKGERISNLRKDLEQLEGGTGNLHAAKEWNMGNSDRMLQEAFGESSMDLDKTKSSRSKVRPPAKERKAEGAAPKDALAWPMRLNRFVSLSGLCSRRTADELIEAGRITINGNVANVLGTKVEQSDVVKYDDELLQVRRNVYVLLNKPK
ncbi:MAG: S4 domain-containing protein, partial [Bacteroidota bacterium]